MHDLAETLPQLEGTIERVTFHNPENGFCVLRLKVKHCKDLVVAVATVPKISVGESIRCTGEWHDDKTYGKQFKIHTLEFLMPSTVDEIEKYLKSGLIKGIGSRIAKKMIAKFGEDVFTVLDEEPHRFIALEGIPEKRKIAILSSWTQQKSVHDIMRFLQSHGLGTTRAARIYKIYGDGAVAIIKENPYRLALDIPGIGFKTTDALAMSLGIAPDSMQRAQAGVRYALQEWCDQGHCAAEYQQLVATSKSLLGIAESIITEAIEKEITANNLIAENIRDKASIFPASLYHCESEAAKHLLRIRDGQPPWGEIDSTAMIHWVEDKTQLQLAPSQKEAIEVVLGHKITIITGGPGVGKTTIVNSIIKIIQTMNLSVALCAPTGRAAKRLTETTGLPAKTIHRLLGLNSENAVFQYNRENPLPHDVVVVDEASMIDIVLFYRLLKVIPDHSALLFVGDVDQLPSVGPGAVLIDMIRSQTIPTVRLTEIFRQAANSKIIVNAHRINQGELPEVNKSAESDFYTIYANGIEEIQQQVVGLVSKRLPDYLGCNPINDIQVLTPMNRGGLGTIELNNALQAQLNHNTEALVKRAEVTFRIGDKVIQMINNYEKEIFNGDIGFIAQINLKDNVVQISFDQRLVQYTFKELDEISLAYAISIHKSQGSEFPIVVIPLSVQHYRLLARNLLYTGVTRGKSLVVLVVEKRALQLAVTNNRENKRLTNLVARLS